MLVHPAALRPIPMPLPALGVGAGILFLVLVMGLSRGDVVLTVDPALFQLTSQYDPLSEETDARIVSVRSNTVLVELSLSPSPATVGDRGGVFFQRADGMIFPVVGEAWVERPGKMRSVLFVSPADGLLLSRIAGSGRFLWKAYDESFTQSKRLERRLSVLQQGKEPRNVAENTDPVSAGDPAQTSSIAIPPAPESLPVRESVVWFPGDMFSYVITPEGGIDRVLPNGAREKVRE